MKELFFLFCIFNVTLTFALDISGKIVIKDKSGSSVDDKCEDVVVFISSEGKKLENKTVKTKVVAKDSSFSPGVHAISQGSEIQFPNEDPILHNVFSLSKTKKFDLGLYQKGAGKSVKFDRPGLVKVYCNIHPGMVADILVLDNSFYTKGAKNCSYSIKNVPAGSYKLSAWYRYGKGKEIPIKMTKSLSQNVELTHTKNRLGKHKNKFGKSYKAGY